MLAPMAGYTDAAFRMICKEQGAGVVMSELISADAIAHGKFEIRSTKIETNSKIFNFKKVTSRKNHNTAELLSFFEEERPFVVQLFGKNPDNFAMAARWISENLKPDGIDINMGCPARKVVGSDHGAALMRNPILALEIIKAVKNNSNLPVSVKTRLGWENDGEILKFVPLLVNAGIDAITIHGRTYKDGFKNKARWENIYKIKEMFGDKLIVVGNGDITSISNIQFSINNNISRLDGIAIGRAAFGKPWIFNEVKNTKKLEVKSCKLGGIDKELIIRHAKLAYKTKGDHGIIEFRKHLLAYLKGFSNAKSLRMKAVKIEKLSDIEEIVREISAFPVV